MSSSTNSGLPYEQLTQAIFQRILALDDIHTINVQHNVILDGKSVDPATDKRMRHQIDVYWEFEVGGVRYRTAIQAKDWATHVPLSAVLTFKSVLDDLPGQVRGIMVTKTGFQSGAQTYADANGIERYILRKPTAEDLAGRFTRLQLNIRMLVPRFDILAIDVDASWLSAHGGMSVNPQDALLLAADGTPRGSIADVLSSHLPADHRELPPTEFQDTFPPNTYIEIPGGQSRGEIKSITSRISTVAHDHHTDHDFTDLLAYIVRSATGDKTYFVNQQGEVRRSDSTDPQ